MAPSAVAEVLARQETRLQVTSPAPHPVSPPRSAVERGPSRAKAFFEETLLESHHFKNSSKTLDFLVALLFHVAVLGGPIGSGSKLRQKSASRWRLRAWRDGGWRCFPSGSPPQSALSFRFEQYRRPS